MAEELILSNAVARAILRPLEGGRVSSFQSLLSDVEFLWQAPSPWRLQQPSCAARFMDGAAAGIEECLPTVASCVVEEEQIPDHGDFWQQPWQLIDQQESQITLQAEGFSRPLQFTKQYSLKDSTLRVDAVIRNIGVERTSFHYALHPLLAVDAEDCIFLAPGCDQLALYDSLGERLGKPGSAIHWPHVSTSLGERLDLSRIGRVEDRSAEMLYTSRLQYGLCGLYRSRASQGITLRFPVEKLPWMGLWICCGGWPEDGSPLQYAFAPEPTTAPCGSLLQALEQDAALWLEPGDSFLFEYEFILSEPNLSRAEFIRKMTPSS